MLIPRSVSPKAEDFRLGPPGLQLSIRGKTLRGTFRGGGGGLYRASDRAI